MVNIIKEELSLEESLRKKIEFICDFTNEKIILNVLVVKNVTKKCKPKFYYPFQYRNVGGLRSRYATRFATVEKSEIKYSDIIDYKITSTNDLELLVPNFKVASAIIHYDETSPHLHIVGVPIKYKNKNGMEKQVGKSDVFTKESLIRLQDKMRTLCIEEFNQVYSLDSTLKKKQKGRNRDIHVSDMDNYIEMKKQIEKNTENLKQANKKSSELKNNSKDIKDKIDKLKTSKLNKDNYILSKEDKDSFINFINQVDNTSKEYDKIQTLSNTLVTAHEQLKDKNNKIKTLTENNEALNLRVKTLNNTIKEKDNEISFLKSKIQDIQNTLEYWKDKFEKLISFLHSKLHSWYDKDDKYIDVVNDMYEDNVLEDDDIEELDLSKEKDDFEK